MYITVTCPECGEMFTTYVECVFDFATCKNPKCKYEMDIQMVAYAS